jgi:ketosteroid isomerase-like protein
MCGAYGILPRTMPEEPTTPDLAQENVEVVKRVMRGFADQDTAAALADVDPQATLDWSNSDALDSGVYTGHAAWRAFVQARDEVLGGRRFDSVEFLTPTADTVVLIVRMQEQGRASGIEVATHGAAVWTLHGGKIVRLKIYQSSAEALKAVGLAA